MYQNDRLFQLARRHVWVVCALLALSAGCRDTTAPSLDPALTAHWVQNGIDTYAEFVLEKRGVKVTGTYSYRGFAGPSPLYNVSGSALLPRVVLTWKQLDHRITFDATLSADTNSLTGHMSIDGQQIESPTTYYRVTYTYPAASP